MDEMRGPNHPESTLENLSQDQNSYLLIASNSSPKLDHRNQTKYANSPRTKKKIEKDEEEPFLKVLGGRSIDVEVNDNYIKAVEEELQHASDMSISMTLESGDISNLRVDEENKSHSTRSSLSGSIRVEIQDIGNDGSFNFTTSTLRKCKKLVLRPYWGLLVFIGWRGFHRESVYSHRKQWRCLNFIYPSCMILLLFYTYMYEILACEWKLNIETDSKDIPLVTIIPPHVTTNQTNVSLNTLFDATPHSQPVTNLSASHNFGCDHIVTTYLIPNLLHFLAYVMGLYYFRIQENEQLYALMEKVFLQATPVQARTASQQKMIHRLRLFLGLGSVWVFCSVLLQCLYAWAFDFPKLPLFERIGVSGYWILFGIELLGRTVFNSVILAIVMNYTTQCEMIKFYVRGLGMRLQEKSTDLKTAMKDVLMLRQSLSLLNGIISKMTSLAAVILAELTIIGICILCSNEIDNPKVWAFRSLFPVLWACMLSVPLFQAARVNSICLRIQKIALETRLFGYKGASILDLDSFLQFVTLTKLKAKLFHITMAPSHLIFTCVVAAFILLILVQTGSIGPKNYFI